MIDPVLSFQIAMGILIGVLGAKNRGVDSFWIMLCGVYMASLTLIPLVLMVRIIAGIL